METLSTPARVTDPMPIDEIRRRYDDLQRKLGPLWRVIGGPTLGGPDEEANTVVVVPSLSVDIELSTAIQQAYEERFLFLLFLLRQPNIRLIYVTSGTIDPQIVEYYLHILPGVAVSNARKRLFLLSPQDLSSKPLTEKLLERPRVLERIRALVPDHERAHLVPFNTTDLERELAVRLGIPMYAADPELFAFGTKSGSRRVFAEEGVPHPLGCEDLFGMDDLAGAIRTMRAERPAMAQVIVKLNEGVSGLGNAVVHLAGLPPPGDAAEAAAIADRLRAMQMESPDATFDAYMSKLRERGGIVEERIVGNEIRSPSAQLRVTPLGDVELLSTHDQLLGGPSGQSYLGARFPADPAYGPRIMREAARVGRRFAREGVVGRFALDFVVTRDSGGDWQPYAIEVNLRKGGTTHPFLTLQYLTDGRYDVDTGLFTTSRGRQKWYVASDHVESPAYRALSVDDLFDIVSRHHLHFDHATQTGVILHMMSGVAAIGRCGVTAVADDEAGADALYHRFVSILDDEAARANARTI